MRTAKQGKPKAIASKKPKGKSAPKAGKSPGRAKGENAQTIAATAPRGRPSLYSESLADEICQGIASGISLKRICQRPHMPNIATVLRWVTDPPASDGVNFHDLYVRAREACAHLWSSELIELADDSSGDYVETEDGRRVFNGENVQRSKLRYEARRWVCSKLIRAYSDTNIEVTGKDGGPVKVETDVDELELARWICYKLALGAEAKKRLEAKGDATDIEPSR